MALISQVTSAFFVNASKSKQRWLVATGPISTPAGVRSRLARRPGKPQPKVLKLEFEYDPPAGPSPGLMTPVMARALVKGWGTEITTIEIYSTEPEPFVLFKNIAKPTPGGTDHRPWTVKIGQKSTKGAAGEKQAASVAAESGVIEFGSIDCPFPWFENGQRPEALDDEDPYPWAIPPHSKPYYEISDLIGLKLRVIPPGTVITDDFVPDRANLFLGANGRIAAITFG